MLEACLTPSWPAEITLQPVRRHGVDAAILFSDIVVPLKLAGVDVEIVPGAGPVVAHPVRTAADVAAAACPLDPAALAPISEAVAPRSPQLGATPLIGFAGAPFTLASYLVEGGPSRGPPARPSPDARRPRNLARAGAAGCAGVTGGVPARAGRWPALSAVQLFDSWAGSLSLADYTALRRAAFGRASLAALARPGRADGCTSASAPASCSVAMRDAGADVMGVDYRVPLDEANAPARRPHAAAGQHRPGAAGGAVAGARGARPRRHRAGHGRARPRGQPRPRRPAGHRPGRADPPGRAGPRALTMTWDAVVVGGGIAGLVAARELAHEGLRTLCWRRATPRAARSRGTRSAGLRLDAGRRVATPRAAARSPRCWTSWA